MVRPMAGDGEAALVDVRDLKVHFTGRRGVGAVLRHRPPPVVRAVDGVDLVVRRGEMVALVGESGSGKTTTALAMVRMVRPTSGAIHVAGQDITTLGRREIKVLRRRMQMIFQDPYESLDPRFRVGQAVEEPLLVHKIGRSRDERRAMVGRALEGVDLTPADTYVRRYPHELSGGQRQRVALAASLVLAPDLLIADEPVSMLDVSLRAGVLGVMDQCRTASGAGILMITHDLAVAARFADRIAVMHRGRIVEEGLARSVVRDPRHPYSQALLAARPGRLRR